MREGRSKVELFRIQIGTWQVASPYNLSPPAVLPAGTSFVLGLSENVYEKAQRTSRAAGSPCAAGSLRAEDSPWVCFIVG